jgi:hypothetical protein
MYFGHHALSDRVMSRTATPMTCCTATIDQGSKSSKDKYAVDMAKKNVAVASLPAHYKLCPRQLRVELERARLAGCAPPQAEVAGVHDHHQAPRA